MSPDLLFKAIFRYWNYFMSSVSTDGMDGQSVKLEKIGPTFSSFNVMPQKVTKILLWSLLPNKICFMSS